MNASLRLVPLVVRPGPPLQPHTGQVQPTAPETHPASARSRPRQPPLSQPQRSLCTLTDSRWAPDTSKAAAFPPSECPAPPAPQPRAALRCASCPGAHLEAPLPLLKLANKGPAPRNTPSHLSPRAGESHSVLRPTPRAGGSAAGPTQSLKLKLISKLDWNQTE